MVEVKHFLNDILIDEPIGFDKFKTTIKRDKDYHGMSVEVGIDELEFYGTAAEMIRNAFAESLDFDLLYVVMFGNEEAYRGKLDLSTYKEQQSEYCSVSCKVGEIGVKTTFNNRSDVEIDLNGNDYAEDNEWQNITIPTKTIVYKNRASLKEDLVFNDSPAYRLPDDFYFAWMNILPRSGEIGIELNEFGSFCDNEQETIVSCADVGENLTNLWLSEYATPLFKKADIEEFKKEFGENSKISIRGEIKVEVSVGTIYDSLHKTDNARLELEMCLVKDKWGGSNVIQRSDTKYLSNDETDVFRKVEATFEMKFDKKNLTFDELMLGIFIKNTNYNYAGAYNNEAHFSVTIYKGSYIEMSIESKIDGYCNPKVMYVYNAMNKIVKQVSEGALSVKSDWYRLRKVISNEIDPDFPYEKQTDLSKAMRPLIIEYGKGARKLITNGYKFRNLDKPFAVSFKSMVENLNAIDCIGWGFSTENGETFVRVERWDWFYKDDVIFTITAPNKITRSVDSDKIITSLNIGYKKYKTSEQVNSIDNIHSERTFTSNINAITKEKKALCEFVADNFAIELTRRNALNKNTEEFEYDENIFIFSVVNLSNSMLCDVDTDLENYGVTNISELYNAKISPMRNALRWADCLFFAQGSTEMKFNAGKINTEALFSTLEIGNEDFQGLKHAENENILAAKSNRKMRAEVVAIDNYPMTIQQYKNIIAQPMGIVVVDGEECWIKEFSYSFADGTADFKLTPKNIEL